MASIAQMIARKEKAKKGKIHFVCPLCQYPQGTNTIRRVTWRNHLQLAVLTAACVVLAWPLFGGKGVALYFLFWGIFEFAFRLRKRQALVCQSCGFDPFLYKQDVKRAREALRKHWQTRIETENLFAGKKLRNYRTSGVGQEGVPEGAVLPEKTSDASPPGPTLS